MRILIAVASRHGSTRDIAIVIGQELRAAGHTVDVHEVEAVPSIESYDAVILGSALYIGSWLPAAQQFVERNHAYLAGKPVWLFSSGPLGWEQPNPQSAPGALDELMQRSHAREHRVFAGKLDKLQLGIGERLVSKMVGAPEGDFRDWEAIRVWAREIASALSAPAVVGA